MGLCEHLLGHNLESAVMEMHIEQPWPADRVQHQGFLPVLELEVYMLSMHRRAELGSEYLSMDLGPDWNRQCDWDREKVLTGK